MARCVPPYVRETGDPNDPYGDHRVSDTEGSRWLAFVHDTMPRPPSPATIEAGRRQVAEWDRGKPPHVYRPVSAEKTKKERRQDKKAAKKAAKEKKTRKQRMKDTIMRKPHVTLALRMLVFALSIAALYTAVQIYQHDAKDFGSSLAGDTLNSLTSPLMAIVVDAVALPYTLLLIADELAGKPIGMRHWYAKLRIIYLDILFIIVESANLALAFEYAQQTVLLQRLWEAQGWLIPEDEKGDENRYWMLAGILLVALLAWSTTFMISVLRVVMTQRTRTHNLRQLREVDMAEE